MIYQIDVGGNAGQGPLEIIVANHESVYSEVFVDDRVEVANCLSF